jgi:quinol monooxygenase YgiN
MIRSTIRMLIPFEKQFEALRILGSMIEEIQFEPGCIGCYLYKGVEDDRVIMLEELWVAEEDFRRHMQSKKYSKILLVIEMASEFPEIRFDLISETRGFEIIENIRS